MKNLLHERNLMKRALMILMVICLPVCGVFAQTTQTFSSSGSWTVPYGVTSITVETWGAGGAGGGCTNKAGGGGGGGGYSTSTFSVTYGTVFNYIVGAGGVGSATAGDDGGATSFNGTVIANGGAGGGLGTTTDGTGGTGGTGTTHNGGTGGTAIYATGSGGGGGSAGASGNGGNGAALTAGAAGTGGGVIGAAGRSSNGVGTAGAAPGAGGSGAKNNGAAKIGGNGGDGEVKITYTVNCTAPPAQPTSLILTAAATSIAGSFSAETYADGYLVVRTTSSSAPSNPVDGTTYTAGTSALGGTIVYAGATASFNSTGLTGGTQYWFWVYDYNNVSCVGGIKYLTASALSNTATAGVSSIVNTFNSSTTWTCPNGVTSIKVECWGAGGAGGGTVTVNRSGGGGAGGDYKMNAAVAVTPGTVYTVTVGTGGVGSTGNGTNGGPSIFLSVQGDGGAFGSGGNGTNGAKGAKGAAGTYGGGDGGAGANAASGGGGGGAGSTGNATNAGAAPGHGTGGTTDGGNGGAGVTTSSNGINGSDLGGGGSGALSLNGTSYIGGNGGNGQVRLTYTNPCSAPATQPTSLVLTPSSTTVAASFTASTTADGYLVIRTTTSSAPSAPVNGTSYTAGTSALGGHVESAGTGISFTSTSLSAGTQYWYWVYAYSSTTCTGGIVYKASSPLSGNTTTLSAPTSQPTSLTLTTYTNIINGSFTASSPAASGYLVVMTTSASAPTNPTDGTVYTAGNTALGGTIISASAATTYSETSLTPSTQYWFWVYAYNGTTSPVYHTASPLSNNSTTLAYGSQTNYSTLPETGPVNWSTITWSLGHTPTTGENAQVTFTGTTAANVSQIMNITSDVTVVNLTLINSSTSSTYNKVFKTIGASGVNITVNGNLSISAPASKVTDTCIVAAIGNITIAGNTTVGGSSDAAYSVIGAAGSYTNQTWTFKGNLTFNAKSLTLDQGTVMIMDGTGAQTLTNNTNTSPYTDAVLFEAFKIGSANTPSVTLAGTNYNFFMNDKGGYLDVAAGSTLVLPSGYTFNAESIVTPGTYNSTLYNRTGSTIKVGGNTGGPAGSNFPYHFTTNSIHANSIVNYNGASSITQTVYNGITYGKLVVSNGTGSGTAAKTTTGSLTVNTQLDINALTTLTLGSTMTCNGPLNVLASGDFVCAGNVVSGTGTFVLASGSDINIGNSGGIEPSASSGNIQMSGGRTYSSTANYTYSGSASQVTGAGLPSTVANLTIDNPNTVTLSANQTVTGVTTLKQGVLDLGTKKLTISGSGTLTSVAGKMKANTGILEMNGSTGTAQSLDGSWFVNKNISTLINSNTKGITIASTANDTLAISSALLFGSGTTNSTITTNNNLTLLSRDTATARFGEIVTGSGNTITGNVNVERYVGSGRKWRLLSWPTSSSQTAAQSWMESNTPNGNNKPGYGMVVTDNGAGWSANGFDSQSASGPSVKYWNPATGTFVGIPNANTYAMNSQPAYYVYVRGDRSCTAANSTLSSTILRMTGSLITGNQAFNVSANKYAAIGNPYASAVDLRKLDTTNLTGTFYVWDPLLGGGYGLGAYQTIYKSGSNYFVLPGGGSYGAINSAVDTLESGQAVFVKARSSTGTLTFKENAKNIGARTQNREGIQTPEVITQVSLRDPGGNTLMDGAIAAFDPAFSNAVDDDDATKMVNGSENLSYKRNGTVLAVERRQPITADDTLFLNLGTVRVHDYQFDISLQNMNNPGRTAFFVDKYTNTTTPLDFSTTNSELFTIINSPASYAPDRFMIVFRQAPVVLPVRFTSISASRNADKTITVIWKTANEVNLQDYRVQRSTDGSVFTEIGMKLPAANNGGSASYSLIDQDPADGFNYYRVKATSLNGQAQYSSIVKVSPSGMDVAGFSIYPNPVTGGNINLRFDNQAKGTYTVSVTNMLGEQIFTESIQAVNEHFIETINPGNRVAAGSYNLTVTDPAGKSTTISFISK